MSALQFENSDLSFRALYEMTIHLKAKHNVIKTADKHNLP